MNQGALLEYVRSALKDAYKPTLIMVVMKGCGACAMGKSELSKLFEKYAPGVPFQTILAGDLPFRTAIIPHDLLDSLRPQLNNSTVDTQLRHALQNINSFPTYVRMYNGESTRKVGALTADQLCAFLKGKISTFPCKAQDKTVL
jgi:hypothetical protein